MAGCSRASHQLALAGDGERAEDVLEKKEIPTTVLGAKGRDTG